MRQKTRETWNFRAEGSSLPILQREDYSIDESRAAQEWKLPDLLRQSFCNANFSVPRSTEALEANIVA